MMSGNPQGPYTHSPHDPSDVRAFMRMVMELVGMFNEGEMQQVDGKYAFGVMLGDRGHMDDCSSDECDDHDLDDEDDEDDLDEDTLAGGYMGHMPHMAQMPVDIRYSKTPEELAQEEREIAEAEAKRKEKNAKKRKKQREKKQREHQKKEEEAREK